jgi:hypothetical protein
MRRLIHSFADAGRCVSGRWTGSASTVEERLKGDRMKKRLIARAVVSAGALCSLAAVLAAGTKWG